MFSFSYTEVQRINLKCFFFFKCTWRVRIKGKLRQNQTLRTVFPNFFAGNMSSIVKCPQAIFLWRFSFEDLGFSIPQILLPFNHIFYYYIIFPWLYCATLHSSKNSTKSFNWLYKVHFNLILSVSYMSLILFTRL